MNTKLLQMCLFLVIVGGLIAPTPARDWSYAGNTLQGEYVSYNIDKSEVRIRRENGNIWVMKMALLSERDQAYVRMKSGISRNPGMAAGKGMMVVKSGNRYALLIGVNKYSKPIKSLKYCNRDMGILSESFQKIGVPSENIVLMVDSSREDLQPTGANIRRQISAMTQMMTPDDMLIIAFSGHGALYGQESYLCPSDSSFKSAETLVSREWAFEQLDKCAATHKIFLIDACRNEIAFDSSKALGNARTLQDPIGAKSHGFILISSCDKQQLSWESPQLEQGVFSYYFAQGLAGSAIDEDGYVSVLGLFQYVSRKTKLFVFHNFNEVQVPTLKQGGEMTDFYLAKLESRPTLFLVPGGGSGVTPVPSTVLEDVITWESHNERMKPVLQTFNSAMANYNEVTKTFHPGSRKAQDAEAALRAAAVAPYSYCTAFLRQEKSRLESMREEGYRTDFAPFKALETNIAQLEASCRLFSAEAKIEDLLLAMEAGQSPGERRVETVKGVEFAFRWCPAGTFIMGSTKSEWDKAEITWKSYDETQHEVTLSKGFWMLETEVTQRQWQAIMGNNPCNSKEDNLPVEQVCWGDCQEFCKKFNSESGLQIGLPTEAQWEYACRAGTTGAYAGDLDSMAWYNANSDSQTHPVGTKRSNAWGLSDMHGNVCELCLDRYGDYPSGSVTDPTGVSSDTRTRMVCRGGSWDSSAWYCRSAFRTKISPSIPSGNLGFRPVFVPDIP